MNNFSMTTAICNRIRSIIALGSVIGVSIYKINTDLCYTEGARSSQIPWFKNWDGREPTTVRNLFFIRHGQYDLCNPSHPLTRLGIKQAELTGTRLRTMGFPFKLITCSSMRRATETAINIQNALNKVPLKATETIREGVPIMPDPPLPNWHPSEKEMRCDPPRIEAAFHEIIHRPGPCQVEDTYEIFVCHANVIRYFICRALQFSPAAWIRIGLYNCSITWLAVHADGRIEVKALGDHGHLPDKYMTTT